MNRNETVYQDSKPIKSLYRKLKQRVGEWIFRKIDLRINRIGNNRADINICMLNYGELHCVKLDDPSKTLFDLQKNRITKPLKLRPEETSVTTSGVSFGCCFSSINRKVAELGSCQPGDRLRCEHCKEIFQLTGDGVWVPVWQIIENDS